MMMFPRVTGGPLGEGVVGLGRAAFWRLGESDGRVSYVYSATPGLLVDAAMAIITIAPPKGTSPPIIRIPV